MERAVWCENYGTREKHAIRKGMRSVVENFVSATNLLLVPRQQIIGDGLVVTLLQEKRGRHVLLRLSTERVVLSLVARRTKRTHVKSAVSLYVHSEGFP